MWNAVEIRDHAKTAALLTEVVLDAFGYLGRENSATESGVKDFILAEFRRHGLVMDRPFKTPIVAFGNHAADPHYCPLPGTRKLKPGTVVMIDVWARLKGKHMPYADITWMGYYGGGVKISQKKQAVFNTVIAARNACLNHIRNSARRDRLPLGKVADETANNVIRKRGYGKFIRHSTGHALGFVSPHGRYGRTLSRRNQYSLLKNVPYTIEPGVYIKGLLGVRSEINFYVDHAGKVVITTPMQRKLVRIGA